MEVYVDRCGVRDIAKARIIGIHRRYSTIVFEDSGLPNINIAELDINFDLARRRHRSDGRHHLLGINRYTNRSAGSAGGSTSSARES